MCRVILEWKWNDTLPSCQHRSRLQVVSVSRVTPQAAQTISCHFHSTAGKEAGTVSGTVSSFVMETENKDRNMNNEWKHWVFSLSIFLCLKHKKFFINKKSYVYELSVILSHFWIQVWANRSFDLHKICMKDRYYEQNNMLFYCMTHGNIKSLLRK